MPTYLYRWPDGTVTVVEGRDAGDAVIVLDEIGEAEAEHLVELTPREPVLVTFKLTDEGELQSTHELGEGLMRAVAELAAGKQDADV